MRGAPVSLILGIFLIMTAGAADARWPGRGGHGHGQDFQGRGHAREVERPGRGGESESRGHAPVSAGVKCRAHVGWRPRCSIVSEMRRENAETVRALHEEIWDERESAEETVEELHEKIRQLQAKLDEGAAKITKAEVDMKEAAGTKKAAEDQMKLADDKVKQADDKVKGAQEALAAAGKMSADAAKAKQDGDAAKAAGDAAKKQSDDLIASLKNQQEALLKFAEDAKHKQEHDAIQLRTRWDQIFLTLRSKDPCTVEKDAGEKGGRGPFHHHRMSEGSAAETERGEDEADRIGAESGSTGAKSNGVSEGSRASE